MIFTDSDKAKQYIDAVIKSGQKVEVKKVAKTRSSLQNRALHLLFDMAAKELNNLGIPFVYRGLKGMELETEWTAELFKEITWKPLQLAMFGVNSTRKINTEQINKIFDTINRFFADRGVEITFPNKFDQYLKFYSNE